MKLRQPLCRCKAPITRDLGLLRIAFDDELNMNTALSPLHSLREKPEAAPILPGIIPTDLSGRPTSPKQFAYHCVQAFQTSFIRSCLTNTNTQGSLTVEKEPHRMPKALEYANRRRHFRRQYLTSLFTLIDMNGLPTIDMPLPRMTREPRRQWYILQACTKGNGQGFQMIAADFLHLYLYSTMETALLLIRNAYGCF